MIVAIIGLIGLYCLISFAQSTRIGYSGPISTYLSIAQIPAFISILWGLALATGWWAPAFFIVASIAAGCMNAVLAREKGQYALVVAQPVRGILFAISAFAIWSPRLF